MVPEDTYKEMLAKGYQEPSLADDPGPQVMICLFSWFSKLDYDMLNTDEYKLNIFWFYLVAGKVYQEYAAKFWPTTSGCSRCVAIGAAVRRRGKEL